MKAPPSIRSIGFLLVSCCSLGLAETGQAAGLVRALGLYSYVQGNDLVFAPIAVPPDLTNAIAIAAGNHFSLALKEDGTVIGWSDDGTLLTNIPSPLGNVRTIASGRHHSLALKMDGTVVAWGNNSSGQTNVPSGLTGVKAIACGVSRSLALRADGTVLAWGEAANVPDGLTNVVSIAADGWHNFALKVDGTVVGWGDNSYGQENIPPGLTNVVAIAAGYYHVLALKADGTLVTWGTTAYSLGTIPVAATNVVAIAAGESHSLALRADGVLIGWGANHSGQVTVPTTLSNVVAIAGGASHSLAIQNDGAPFISRQPVDRLVYSGMSAELSVGVSSLTPLLYQWRLNGTNLAATGTGLLHLTAVQPADSGVYEVAISGTFGSVTSSPAMFSVIDTGPILVTTPTNRTVHGGSNATFTVSAKGSLPLAYRWRFDEMDILSATNTSLTLTNIQWDDVGEYTVVVSNQFGVATANAALNLIPLTIASQPAPRSVLAGSSASFSVTPVGSGPFSYQWRHNGTNISGAITNPLVIPSALPDDAGNYSVVVENLFGALTSSNALLTVIPLQITEQPKSQVATPGTTAELKVVVAGQGPFAYQWQFQGTNLPSATNAVLLRTNVEPAHAGAYTVTVANDFGSLTSSTATLTVSSVLIWGDNTAGQLNLPGSLTDIRAVVAGDNHFVALKSNGTLVAWGSQTNVPTDLTNVVTIAAGSQHTLALRTDGGVSVWGAGATAAALNNVPAHATNLIALAPGPGAQHALALRADGTVVSWGPGSNYGLTNIPPPANDVVAVAAGSFHAVALRSDGRVVAWGDNSRGQINVPAQATNIVAISAGWYGNAALRADGTILTWGLVTLPLPFGFTNVVDLACPFNSVFGHAALLAVRRDGRVVQNLGTAAPANATNVTAVAAGSFNGLALVGHGPPHFPLLAVNRKVVAGARAYFRMPAVGGFPISYQWSCNGTNLPGATNTVLVLTNVQPELAGNIYRVAASNVFGTVVSGEMTLGVKPAEVYVQTTKTSAVADTDVTFTASTIGFGPFTYQWQFNGTNVVGATNISLVLNNVQLDQAGLYSVIVSNAFGLATSPGQALTVLPLAISAQPLNRSTFRWSTVTFSVTAAGVSPIRYQWRHNGNDLVGETNSVLTLTAIQPGQAGTYSVQVSNEFATIASQNASLTVNSLVVWGEALASLTAIPASTSNAVAVAAGAYHALALRPDGTVVAWGIHHAGQTNVPAGLTNVVAIEGGYQHSLALRADGSAVAWGASHAAVPPDATNLVAVRGVISHALGLHHDGTITTWGYTPYGTLVVPPEVSNTVAVAAGYNHSVALRADGLPIAWGYNLLGQTNTPPDLTNAVAIAAGNNHTLALRADDTVVAWGQNHAGQTNVPLDLTNVVAVAGGWSHSLALKADGTVAAWGDNSYGQTNIPPGLSNVVAISAGANFNLALLGDGPPARNAVTSDLAVSSGGLSFSIPSRSGKVYRLEYKNSLTEDNWTVLQTIAGNGGTLIFTDSDTAKAQRFYRIREW